jgi:hypothetical protein
MQLGLHTKPMGLSAAARSAEQLFETKNVADIREVSRSTCRAAYTYRVDQPTVCDAAQIEARTRKDIEGKSLQLRQLVGDSYRQARQEGRSLKQHQQRPQG